MQEHICEDLCRVEQIGRNEMQPCEFQQGIIGKTGEKIFHQPYQDIDYDKILGNRGPVCRAIRVHNFY